MPELSASVSRSEAKPSSFDKLRMRFSTAEACTMVLILSLSKAEDHAPGLRLGLYEAKWRYTL